MEIPRQTLVAMVASATKRRKVWTDTLLGRRLAVGIGNRVWGNETVMTYLKTGLYRYWVPPAGRIKWKVLQTCCMCPTSACMHSCNRHACCHRHDQQFHLGLVPLRLCGQSSMSDSSARSSGGQTSPGLPRDEACSLMMLV